MKQVAIVGAGFIGQAWAIVFARAGYQVVMWDGKASALPLAKEVVERQLHTLESKGLVSNASSAIQAIRTSEDLEEALDGVIYVQENLPEDIALKKQIFSDLDAVAAPGTILASSTSSIPASEFTEDLEGRQRCLVAHPVNPPYLIPVVELCAAPWTSDKVMADTRQIMNDVGQKPVAVYGEPRGFVLNRLQGALLREAFRMVEQGHVSAEDLDVTVKDGLGLRWAFMGPFETIDLNAPDGLADYCNRYGEMYREIAEEQTSTDAWTPDLIANVHAQRRERLDKNALEARRFWRDDYLMSLLRHKRKQEP